MNTYTKRTDIENVVSPLASSVACNMGDLSTLTYNVDKSIKDLADNDRIKFLSVVKVFETRNNYAKYIIGDLSAVQIARDLSFYHDYSRIVILLPYNKITATSNRAEELFNLRMKTLGIRMAFKDEGSTDDNQKSVNHRLEKVNRYLSNFQLTADVAISEDKTNKILSSLIGSDDLSNTLIIFPSYDGGTDPDVVAQLIAAGCACVEYRTDFDIRYKSNSSDCKKIYTACITM